MIDIMMNTLDLKSMMYLPLYKEFTRILIWPTRTEDEESSYQVWSLSTEIPPDFKSSEVLKLCVPFFKNHHYIAVPAAAGDIGPQCAYFHSEPDCSMFQSAVRVYTFKVILISIIFVYLTTLTFPVWRTSGSSSVIRNCGRDPPHLSHSNH